MRSPGPLPVLLLALAGCRCTPTPMPKPWTDRSAPQVALSVVRPAEGGCVWEKREEPAGTATLLAKLPEDCEVVRLAWSPELARGLVERGKSITGPEGEAIEWTLSLSALDGKPAQELGHPPDGELDDFGIDAAGKVRATTFETLEDEGPARWHGQEFAVPEDLDGAPALVHGWTWDGVAWAHDEARVMGLDDDGNRTDGFAFEEQLGPRSFSNDLLPGDDDPCWVKDEALIDRLDHASGRDDRVPGRWQKLATLEPLYNFVGDTLGQTRTLVRDDGAQAVSVLAKSDLAEGLRLDAAGHAVLGFPEKYGPFVYSAQLDRFLREFVPEATVNFWPDAAKTIPSAGVAP